MNAAVLLALVAFNPAWPPTDSELPPESFSRPELMPDDPAYAPVDDGDRCAGQHGLYGFVPGCAYAISPDERRRGVGVGASVDRAWTYTTGRPDVAIAVLADGVDWDDPDLVNRWRLDPGELEAPRTSTVAGGEHDVNGDGVFNVQDFTSATGTSAPAIDRVLDVRLLARPDRGDTNGNGLLDPQDLIRIFSNGEDDDEDGYVDDIAGWDHLEDDNDPGVTAGAFPVLERFDVQLVAARGELRDGPAIRSRVVAVRPAAVHKQIHLSHVELVVGSDHDLERFVGAELVAVVGPHEVYPRSVLVGAARPDHLEQLAVCTLHRRRVAAADVLVGALGLVHDRQAVVRERRIAADVVRVHDVVGVADVLQAERVGDLLRDRGRRRGCTVRVVRAVEGERDVVLRALVAAVQRCDPEGAARVRVARADHAHHVVAAVRSLVGDRDVVRVPVVAHRLDHGLALGGVIAVLGVLAFEHADRRHVGAGVLVARDQRPALEVQEEHGGFAGSAWGGGCT